MTERRPTWADMVDESETLDAYLYPAERKPGRPRDSRLPDKRRAIEVAVRSLRARNGRITWESVALEIVELFKLDEAGLTERTLRRWADEHGMPHPKFIR